MKKGMLVIAVILWAVLIFYASSKDSLTSNRDSMKFISYSVEKCSKLTNSIHLTNIDTSSESINKITLKLNYPIRKLAHFTIYFILGILLYYTFISFGLSKQSIIIAIAICLLYSITDEYHQTFSLGRSARFKDCIIDLSGAVCGCTLEYLVIKMINKNNLVKANKNIN